jgi:purine-binding chemotaxis protein CheW
MKVRIDVTAMPNNKNNNQLIDWDKVWKTIDWDDEEHSQAALRQRLRQRAQQVARPIKKTDSDTEDTYTALTFDLGSEHYGIDVMLVQSVRTMTKVTRVPGTPRFYRGVVNVRGQIITVLDLRLFFDMTFDEQDKPGELIIARANELEIGLLAHHVEGVITVPREAIEPLDDMRYALGLTMGRLVLLDIERLFEDERLIIGGVEE